MRLYGAVVLLSLFIAGCATFKELEPEPELAPLERGYIELKDGKDNFELDRDGKYFIKFPPPVRDRYYLVLTTPVKPLIRSYLTTTFNDGKPPLIPIADESASSDSVFVFPVDMKSQTFYWVIEGVRQDLVLTMRYRYVPQWRYTFENKYVQFKEALAGNLVDRSTYTAIDANFNTDRLDFAREIPRVENSVTKLRTTREELMRLESVFPPDIAASRDTAYEKYVALKGSVDEELKFQDDYGAVLSVLKREMESRGSVGRFLEDVPYFTQVTSQRGRFPAAINGKISQILLKRLAEIEPYLDNSLRNKSMASRIDPDPSLEAVTGLYRACGQQIPDDTEAIIKFVNRFNVEAGGLLQCNTKFEALKTYFNSHAGSPGESFFTDLVARVTDIKAAIPQSLASASPRYGSYGCAAMLNREIASASNRANDLQSLYQTAGIVAGNLRSRSWSATEMALRDLNEARGYSESPEILSQRTTLVKQFERQLFEGVKTASHQRIDAFIKAHEMAIDNVPALYTDSAFMPVHQLTFSSMGFADLQQKKRQIDSYLENIKYNQFPETSIKSIYADFVRSPRDRGVEKARAIVEHGKFYKGTDKQVKGLITECDVDAAKWVVKPADYRKLFALPVTSNKQGANEYMFRIRLQIPSEAQFPVFDVNLKLPQEVAEKANQQQWYESITIDKKPLKNEGRFRITSPTAINNYEALITPVQMDKEGKNILEVRFKYPGFRVFEVSAMAQVPLIRKN